MQAELGFHGRGGRRAGAGRKRSKSSGVPHLQRAELAARHPVDVTLRVGKGCYHAHILKTPREAARALRMC